MPRRRPRLARGASPTPDSLCKLVERAADVIFRVRLTPRPRLEYINAAVASMTGYSPEEWYATPGLALRIIHAGDRRRLQDAIRGRRVPSDPVVVRWVSKDGAVVRTEICVVAVRSRQGALTAVEGIARDVTRNRGEENAARAEDRLLGIAFEQAPAGLARLAFDSRFLQVNRRVCDITGYAPDELVGRRVIDISPPEEGQTQLALLRQLKATEAGSASIETRLVCKDGAAKRVKVSASRIRGAGGTAECLAAMDVIGEQWGGEEDQPRLQYSGIEVDADRLDVLWNGRPVPLTLKEVLLLRYMIRHRGEMLARDRLLRDVWGYEHSGRSRTLDVHVCRLRRKLPPLGNSLITIGHFGYTLSEAMAGQPASARIAG